MSTELSVGFIGLGSMGAPMCARLLASGWPVRVWNRSAGKTAAAVARGAVAAESPGDVARYSDVVILSLFNADAVEAVVFGEDGIAASPISSVVVDHSTIPPEATRSIAARLKQATGAAWIDAPVSGGVHGASEGTLAIMCGGEPASIERVRPILEAYGQNITRLGDLGAGQATKLCNQVIVGAHILALAEAVALARATGVDAASLPAALAGGWADSPLMRVFLPRMLQPPERPTGDVAVMLKDIESAVEAGRQARSALPLSGTVQQILRLVTAHGTTDADLGYTADFYAGRGR